MFALMTPIFAASSWLPPARDLIDYGRQSAMLIDKPFSFAAEIVFFLSLPDVGGRFTIAWLIITKLPYFYGDPRL